jgi:hypothetical protein
MWQAPVPELSLDESAPGFGDGLPHRLAKRSHRGLGLTRQYIRSVPELTTLLHEASCGLARLLRPPSHFRGQHRAGIQMRANVVGQVRTTTGAQLLAAAQIVGGELDRAEAPRTPHALNDCVVETVEDEGVPFVAAQSSGHSAVEMRETTVTGEHDTIVESDRPQALRALQLGLFHSRLSGTRGEPNLELDASPAATGCSLTGGWKVSQGGPVWLTRAYGQHQSGIGT